MTTTTSFFDKRSRDLLKIKLKANLTNMIFLSVFIFVIFPLSAILALNSENSYLPFFKGQFMPSFVGVEIIVFVAAFVISIMEINYLHNKRKADLYHSLPVTRKQLLFTSWLSSFITVALPFVVNLLINTILVGVMRNEHTFSYVVGHALLGLLLMLTGIAAIISIVFFIAVQVGSIFETTVFSLELLLAPPFISLFSRMLFTAWIEGYMPYHYVDETTNLFLSPATYGFMYFAGYDFPLLATIMWILIAVLLFAVTAIIYNKRKSEMAETPGCKGPVGHILVTICIFFAELVFGFIFSLFARGNSPVHFMTGAVIGGILGGLFVEAVLNRGFKGIKKSLLPMVAELAAVSVFIAVPTFDMPGFAKKVPDVEDIISVEIYTPYNRRNLYSDTQELGLIKSTDPEFIKTVTDLHKEFLHFYRDEEGFLVYDGTNNVDVYSEGTQSRIDFIYETEKGGMRRRYNGNMDVVDKFLSQSTEYIRKTHPLFLTDHNGISAMEAYDYIGINEVGIKPENFEKIFDALRLDIENTGLDDYYDGKQPLGFIRMEIRDLSDKKLPNTQSAGKDYQESAEAVYYDLSGSTMMPVYPEYTNALNVLKDENLGYLFTGNYEDFIPADAEIYVYAANYPDYSRDLSTLYSKNEFGFKFTAEDFKNKGKDLNKLLENVLPSIPLGADYTDYLKVSVTTDPQKQTMFSKIVLADLLPIDENIMYW